MYFCQTENYKTKMTYGKKICETLKAIRSEIASANDIDYTPTPCNHKGDCEGTCPVCEGEMRWLERQLINRKALGKTVAIAGLSLALSGMAYAAPTSPQTKRGNGSHQTPPQVKRPHPPGGIPDDRRTSGVVRRPDPPQRPGRPGKNISPQTNSNTTDIDSIYTTVDSVATFPGGDEALDSLIRSKLSIPDSILAPIKEIHGTLRARCIVKCLIEDDGTMSDAVIEKTTTAELFDNEALRVVRELPPFEPARILDFPVRSWIYIPVEFIYDFSQKETDN